MVFLISCHMSNLPSPTSRRDFASTFRTTVRSCLFLHERHSLAARKGTVRDTFGTRIGSERLTTSTRFGHILGVANVSFGVQDHAHSCAVRIETLSSSRPPARLVFRAIDNGWGPGRISRRCHDVSGRIGVIRRMGFRKGASSLTSMLGQ